MLILSRLTYQNRESIKHDVDAYLSVDRASKIHYRLEFDPLDPASRFALKTVDRFTDGCCQRRSLLLDFFNS